MPQKNAKAYDAPMKLIFRIAALLIASTVGISAYAMARKIS